MRMSKLRTSIDDLFRDQNGIHALLKNLTLMEITSLRPFVPSSMDQLQRIKLVSSLSIYETSFWNNF